MGTVGGASKCLLEMKTSQATSGLLRRHYLGNFHSDLPKSTLSIKPISGFLDLRRAQCDLRETQRPRFCLSVLEHALRDTQAAVVLIEVHSTKFRIAAATAFDTKRTDNLVWRVWAFDDPEGAAPCLGKDFEKLLQLFIDRHRYVSLEYFFHTDRGQLSVDARPQRSDGIIIRCLVSAEADGSCRINHSIFISNPSQAGWVHGRCPAIR